MSLDGERPNTCPVGLITGFPQRRLGRNRRPCDQRDVLCVSKWKDLECMSANTLRFEFVRGGLTDVARNPQGASQRCAYLSRSVGSDFVGYITNV